MSGRKARARILGRVREALSDRLRPEHPGPLAEPSAEDADDRGSSETLEGRFRARLEASGGEVLSFDSMDAAASWVAGLQARLTADGSMGVSEGVSVGTGVPLELSGGVAPGPPERARLGVSWGSGACARTGTVLLDARDGRRTQLFPPVHVVWVPRTSLCETLGAALAGAREDLPSAIGLHSGPSKSADIGRIIVTGVHGPGRLIVGLIPG